MYSHKLKVIRVHAYFGQVCKTLIIDKGLSFKENHLNLLRSFGITSQPEKYVVKLANGGTVDSNEALMNEDRILILPVQEVLNFAAAEQVKQEGEGNKALIDAINSVHMGNFK